MFTCNENEFEWNFDFRFSFRLSLEVSGMQKLQKLLYHEPSWLCCFFITVRSWSSTWCGMLADLLVLKDISDLDVLIRDTFINENFNNSSFTFQNTSLTRTININTEPEYTARLHTVCTCVYLVRENHQAFQKTCLWSMVVKSRLILM